ncbi:MAG: glycerol kinase GlpK [Lachnospiraceae bacterium]|nr:glycerol kinase GlpK [Lachnospiraceae bacterium]
MKKYILGIDQSTQATKAILVDRNGHVTERAALPHRQIINDQGWVEHDLEEIWSHTVEVVKTVMDKAGASADDLDSIGICNQRETICVWDKETGKPVFNAVVWQCSRGKEISDRLEKQGLAAEVRERSGMQLSPYYSAAKAAWILEHVEGAKEKNEKGALCIGTIDAFLVWRMTGNFYTDASNAARTQLFNIRDLKWDERLCEMFGINPACLPEVADSNAQFGLTDIGGALSSPVMVGGIMGDSNGALYGEGCFEKGMVKATYGTGSSIMMNIGSECVVSEDPGAVTSIAWSLDGKVEYVLEGNINYSAATIRWLEKDLKLISNPGETEQLAYSANPKDRTYLVPAFSGLGSPYWDNDAEGMVCGMTRVTGKAEFTRAALDCIDYQITDVLKIMEKISGVSVSQLRTDGGATKNNYLMQFQSDIMNCEVSVSLEDEVPCLGPVFAAGLKSGFFTSLDGLVEKKDFYPAMDEAVREEKLAGWKKAVQRCLYRP